MDNEDKKNLKARLDEIKIEAQNISLGDNPNDMLMKNEEFPDLNNMVTIEVTKYQDELEECQKNSKEVVTNLASLWLDNDSDVLSQPYIKNRIEHDSKNQGSLVFLSSVAQQVLMKQLAAMENGDQSPRHFEIIYKGMGELEKINKSATNSLANMENFYRRLRFDVGLEDTPKFGRENKKNGDKDKQPAFSGSMKDLNKLLEEQAKKMREEEDEKKPKKNNPKDSGSEQTPQ